MKSMISLRNPCPKAPHRGIPLWKSSGRGFLIKINDFLKESLPQSSYRRIPLFIVAPWLLRAGQKGARTSLPRPELPGETWDKANQHQKLLGEVLVPVCTPTPSETWDKAAQYQKLLGEVLVPVCLVLVPRMLTTPSHMAPYASIC